MAYGKGIRMEGSPIALSSEIVIAPALPINKSAQPYADSTFGLNFDTFASIPSLLYASLTSS